MDLGEPWLLSVHGCHQHPFSQPRLPLSPTLLNPGAGEGAAFARFVHLTQQTEPPALRALLSALENDPEGWSRAARGAGMN